MKLRLITPLLFATLVVGLLVPQSPRALAQEPPEAEAETFKTADGMQLRGMFQKSAKNPASDPVVIMIYPPGKDNHMDKGDWKGLSRMLAKEGYNVFRFDWRGHGKSTDIKDTTIFWNRFSQADPNPNPFTGPWHTNRMITGAPTAGSRIIKNDLFYKDLRDPVRYAPVLLQDLAAARYHLDSKNDVGEVNTSSIYLVGAESAATVGMAWLMTEWNRPAFAPGAAQLLGPVGIPLPGGFPSYKYVPQPLNGGVGVEAGADIAGAIWLTATRPTSVSERSIKDWMSRYATRLRETNHMLFLYGPDDAKGKAQADFFFNEVLVAKPRPGTALQPLDQTFEMPVKGGGKLSGVSLLGAAAGGATEETMIKFLAAIQKERARLPRKPRNFVTPWFVALQGIPGLTVGFGFPSP